MNLLRRKLSQYANESANSRILHPSFRQYQLSEAVTNSVILGNMNIVQLLSTHFSGCSVPRQALVEAAKLGRVEIAHWLEDNHRDTRWDTGVVGVAVANNHIGLAKWLSARTDVSNERMLRLWSTFVAVNGDLETLQWVCSLSENVHLAAALNEAVSTGQLELVQWIMQHPGVVSDDLRIYLDRACSNGHVEVLEWVIQRYPTLCRVTRADTQAALNGRLDIVRLLHENDIEGCTGGAMACAASRGHIEIVKWLRNCKHLSEYTYAMDGAAENNHLDVIKWLHHNRTEGCSTFAMEIAAAKGNLEVVKWLSTQRTEGCTTRAMDVAASGGHLEIVKFLHFNHNEGCTTDAMDFAARNGQLEVVKCLSANRSEGCTVAAMDGAAEYGQLDVVKWLHDNRIEGCTVAAINTATWNGHLAVVEWLDTNRSEGCTTSAMDEAAKNHFWDVVDWLGRNRTEGGTAATMTAFASQGDIEGVYWCHYNGFTPCNITVIQESVLNGHYEIAWFLHQYRQWNHCDAIQALRECSNPNRRWEFAEWLYSHHRDKFEKVAEDIFAGVQEQWHL